MNGVMGEDTTEIGLTTKWMEKGVLLGQTEEFTKENILKTKNKEMEFSNGRNP